ncbi:MAG: hypothetical protein PHE68_01680 [Candidatus Peribacteraceae bacterium]|nr:hypothetical protein [Candidatus Peribacteraceae bacterium]MDD5074357.1 hypothetical protein [Candidatus Peribacteraceae bacterium]
MEIPSPESEGDLPPLFGGGDSLLGMTRDQLCTHVVRLLNIATTLSDADAVAYCAEHTRAQLLELALDTNIPLNELIPFHLPLSGDIVSAGMREWRDRGGSASHQHGVVSIHETDGEGVMARSDGTSVLMSEEVAFEVAIVEPRSEEIVRLMLSYDALEAISAPPTPLTQKQAAFLQKTRRKLRDKFGLSFPQEDLGSDT